MGKTGRQTMQNDGKQPKGLAARAFAVKALSEVLRAGILQDNALEAVRASNLAGNDKSFTHAIVATSLRRHGQIMDVLQQFLTKPLPSKSGFTPEILIAAAAQILFMSIPPHAAIDMAVRLARQDRNGRHFSGLTNAVLRRVSEHGAKIVAAQDPVALNFPTWMLDNWSSNYGPETASRIGAALLEEAPLDISVKADAEKWAETLEGELLANGSIRIKRIAGQITSLPGYTDGEWWVQDAAATFPVKFLGEVKGKRILDLCAAPGGKTAQLAAAGANVTALDSSAERLKVLSANLERLHFQATTIVANAATYTCEQLYDAVIADVPCSATGTLRRHPDGLHVKTKTSPQSLRPLQEAILANAIALTRPGGTIVYCTCSLETQEGEHVISDILAGNPTLNRAAVDESDVFGNRQFINIDGDLRILPCQSIGDNAGLDGFFAARLVKS